MDWTNILIEVLILLAILSGLIYYMRLHREYKSQRTLAIEIDRLTKQHKVLQEKYKDFLSGGLEKSIESVDQHLLRKATEVVQSNMSDPSFSVEKLAKELGMSRTNMHRKIKAITGIPPSELIRDIRMKKAAALLIHKADSVSQISYKVGFEDHSYFSKSFKKQFGVTPTEYHHTNEQLN